MSAAFAYRLQESPSAYEYLTPEEARVFRETGVLPSRVEVWPDTGASKRILRIEGTEDTDTVGGDRHDSMARR
jgi:hypothetical protein